jgi:hypothetical protein
MGAVCFVGTQNVAAKSEWVQNQMGAVSFVRSLNV